MNLNDHKTDKAKERAGIWAPFDGAEFLIASKETPAYQRALTTQARKHPQQRISRDPELAAKIAIEAMADAVLLDWKGDVNENGVPLEPTRENKIKLLNVGVFRDFVSGVCQDTDNYRAEGERAVIDEGKQ